MRRFCLLFLHAKTRNILLFTCKILCKASFTVTDFPSIFRNPPLLCVVARVQFAPIQKIASYVENLQEALRTSGYPLFEERTNKGVQIHGNSNGVMNVENREISQWDFSNAQKTVAARLDHESLTLFFGDYHNFEEVRSHYLAILQALEDTIPKITLSTLQLRYITFLPLEVGEEPKNWLQESLLGMPNLQTLQRQGSVSETSFQNSDGGMIFVRCHCLHGGFSVPADLLPLPLNMHLKQPLECNHPFILLENVHVNKAQKQDFVAEQCLSELSAMRPQISEVFLASTTKKAHQKWK